VSLGRTLTGALIGLLAGAAAVGAAYTPLLETWERRTLDLRTRTFADPARADPRIVAVVIDQRSLDAIAAPRTAGGLEQGWPWPRDYYAAVLDYLFAAGARAIAFDLVFSERSIYTQLEVADDDRVLAAATSGRPVVQSVMLTREALEGSGLHADRAWPPGLLGDARVRRLKAPAADPYNKATLPVEPLFGTAAALGWIGFEPDEDGTCRSILPTAVYSPAGSQDAAEVWSLPFALAVLMGARVEAPVGPAAAHDLRVNGRRVALDEERRLLLRFHGGEGTYREFGFAAVLAAAKRAAAGQPVEAARPEEFRDKVVLVGATAAGLLDLRATSMRAVLPGYVIHATALDNILHGDGLRRPTWVWRTAVLLVLGAVAGALCGAVVSLRASTPALLGLLLLYVATALWLFAGRGIWLELVPAVLALTLTHTGVTGYGYFTEGRQRRFLRQAFARYVAPEVVDQLVRDPRQLALGGETRTLTVMFADVAGFTSLSEGRAPKEIVELMNECFTELTAVIQGHGGTVDKFIGDAVMAFWNAPVEQPDHAARACRATRDLLLALERLNIGWAARGLPAISMRVGLASGPALVGNVGSTTKFNYTVMGDTVNLASRLEGGAKVYSTLSLIADSTVKAADGAVPVRELDRLTVKGRTEPVPVYEVLAGPATAARAEAHARYAEGLAAYRARRFAEAHEHFVAALKAEPDDGAARVLLEQSEHYLLAPPPPEWRGEHVMHSK
jgi:adenylate cyclase